MAISVSTTTAVSNNADNIVISKPVGVSVGDLLLIAASGSGGYPSVSGFTQVATASNTSSGLDAYVVLLQRVADSTDVSASNYTVTLTGSDTLGAAAMLKVSGLGNSVLQASPTAGGLQDAASWTVTSGTLSIERPSEHLLLMIGSFDGNSNSGSFGSYSITSGDANPTWTEVFDTQYSTQSQPVDRAFFCAYTISSDDSPITQYSVGVNASTSGTSDAVATLMAMYLTSLNATVSNALFQTTPVTFTTLTGSTQEPTNDFMAIEPEIFGVTVAARSNSVWTNPNKPSTNWSNQDK